MLLVVEVPEETQAVELVVRVGVVQPLQELQLLEARLLPADHQNRPVRGKPDPEPCLLLCTHRLPLTTTTLLDILSYWRILQLLGCNTSITINEIRLDYVMFMIHTTVNI